MDGSRYSALAPIPLPGAEYREPEQLELSLSKMSKDGRFPPRTIRWAGRQTSVRLEPEFWNALADVADRERLSIGELVSQIDAERRPNQALAPSIRLFLMQHYRNRAERRR